MSHSFNARACVFSAARAAVAAVFVASLSAIGAGSPPEREAPPDRMSPLERRFLTPAVQVTQGMTKAGEGYFAPDMRRICYQAVPDHYPFYQIFVQPFDASAPRPASPLRISTGRGRTTCSYFSPDGRSLLFASSHLDPALDATEAAALAQAEEDKKTGRRRRYQWDFDPHSDIFVARLDASGAAAGRLERLTSEPGYDAECAYSPDGRRIVFVSDRDGDPDVYVMDADGRNVRQLTNSPGYDGGPFFSPDGQWIAYRTDRLEKDMLQIHVMRADGSGDVAVTSGKGVHWAPFWHPLRPWLIWTGADHSDPERRPNYDLWIARYAADGGAENPGFRVGTPLRITDHQGADVLPVFSPDGSLLMWTASRGDAAGGRGPASQLWVSRLNSSAIAEALPAPRPAPARILCAEPPPRSSTTASTRRRWKGSSPACPTFPRTRCHARSR